MAARMSTWRDAALREMGLGPIWVRRGSQASAPLVPEASASQQAAVVSQQAAVVPPRAQVQSVTPPLPAPAALAV